MARELADQRIAVFAGESFDGAAGVMFSITTRSFSSPPAF
jgi:hypothetical protein